MHHQLTTTIRCTLGEPKCKSCCKKIIWNLFDDVVIWHKLPAVDYLQNKKETLNYKIKQEKTSLPKSHFYFGAKRPFLH